LKNIIIIIYNMSQHKSEDYKISAVKYYLKIKHQTNTCEIFECSQRSLMRWVEKYNKNKTIKRKSRKAVSYKVTQQHIKYIKTQLKTNKTISMQELSNILVFLQFLQMELLAMKYMKKVGLIVKGLLNF
tara:strand:- start:26 stop:412 length:387 start_codon:yes stop_codon:yes gene_type:complete